MPFFLRSSNQISHSLAAFASPQKTNPDLLRIIAPLDPSKIEISSATVKEITVTVTTPVRLKQKNYQMAFKSLFK